MAKPRIRSYSRQWTSYSPDTAKNQSNKLLFGLASHFLLPPALSSDWSGPAGSTNGKAAGLDLPDMACVMCSARSTICNYCHQVHHEPAMSRLIVHHAYLVNWLLALHWHRECTAAVNKVLPTCAAASDTRAVTPVEVAAAPPGGLLPRLLLPLMRRIVLLLLLSGGNTRKIHFDQVVSPHHSDQRSQRL